MAHNFKDFPELTNTQMQFYYFESPHKQITEDFRAHVENVHDGDTISVSTDFRDFIFPIRFLGIDTKELSEGGEDAKKWTKKKIEGKDITVLINSENRVGKYGRLLGEIISNGMNINNELIRVGKAVPFTRRNEGKLPNINKDLGIKKWL